MGLFDLPAPVFSWLDAQLGSVLGPTARLILWGIIAGVASMALYWAISPQQRLTAIKADALRAREALNGYDGDFGGAWPLMRNMLRASLRQLGATTWPALLASIPVLALIAWVSTNFGYGYPDSDQVGVRAYPSELQASLDASTAPSVPMVRVFNGSGETIREIALARPVSVIHKWQWWNALFGNPAGYLPDNAEIERVEIDLPAREYLPLGPHWLRAWYFLFFSALLVGSLGLKMIWRIE